MSEVQDIDATKDALREHARALRAGIDAADRAERSLRICALFCAEIAMADEDIIACYWPIRDEVDCQPLLARLVDDGRKVCLPVVTGEDDPLEMRLWAQGAALYPAGLGTLAPDEFAERVTPSLIVVPLLGFDAAGTRLGYGGGHYDRTLARLDSKPRLIGLAFAGQELVRVPREPHDVPLDAVVTEAGVRHFGGTA